MPFDKHDALRQSGYSEGDELILFDSQKGSINSLSTTSTTYVDAANFHSLRVQWDEIAPTNGQVRVSFKTYLNVGTDETAGVRLRNITDDETILEETDITGSGFVEAGPTDYTPTTTNLGITIRMQLRTDPGANSSSLTSIHSYYSVQL